jgi:ATP-dependent RNA helicase DeaD
MEKILFTNLNLSNDVLKAVVDMGFEEATPIQSLTIPEIMKGSDVIGQANTGTGKTAAFGIPIIEMLDDKSRDTQAIILSPTRELAVQIAEEIKTLAKYKRNVSIIPVYGGQPIDRQIYALKKGVQIVIGTPGRVIDHIERKTLKLDNVKMVVLDEADEMLDMGFVEDIELILKNVPKERQTIFFSATMSKDFMSLTKKFQKDPKFLKVAHEQQTIPAIKQTYYEVKESGKLELMSRILDLHSINLSIVFCNTKKRVDEVVAGLQARGYFADALHGDMNQAKRDRVMARFRKGEVDILVATDVAARGLDIDDVEAVFNFDVPQDEEYYVHRIGRTGRAGKSGFAFAFVSGRDVYKLRDIQRYAKIQIERASIPSLEDVEEARMSQFFEKIKESIGDKDIEKYINMVEHLLGKGEYTSLDVAGALLKMIMKDKVDSTQKIEEESRYSNNSSFGSGSNTGARRSFSGSPDKTKLFINIGRTHNVLPGDILSSIATETGVKGSAIGKIEIFDFFSFVEVPNQDKDLVISKMNNKSIKGMRVRLEVANARK